MDYVGMDLGRRQSHVCWVTGDGEVKHLRVASTREGLTKAFTGRSGRVLIEAAAMSEWVARLLESLGTWEVVVADPNYAPMYGQRSRRIKTDRRDAEALLHACIQGTYRKAHRLSDEARLLRMTVNVRKRLVQVRAQAAVHGKALVTPYGIRIDTSHPNLFPSRCLSAGLSPELSYELAPLIDLVTHLNVPIEATEERLKELSLQDPCVRRLMSVPGVGPVTAAAWIGAMDRADRFESGEQVVSFLGLVPSEWSSSEQRLQGRITKVGPSDLRSLLVECAWRIRNHPLKGAEQLREWANGIEKRRGTKKAMVALARKLARILFVIWRDETTFSAARTQPKATAIT